jgi:hypothetical protein
MLTHWNQGQLFSIGWWFSPGSPVSCTNKTDRHDITVIEIMLKVTLNANFLYLILVWLGMNV